MNALVESMIYTIVVMTFLLGGDYSPLSIFKWYRTFIKSIGL